MGRGDWMQTFTGRQFWPLDPQPEDIYIEDIAHSLALQCRFAGHCESFYSVAQHSVLVSRCCSKAAAKAGLLHDAAEAYLVDLPRPVKGHSALGTEYKKLEEAIMRCICLRFDLPYPLPEEVKKADNVILMTEARDLMKAHPHPWDTTEAPLADVQIIPLQSGTAEKLFLERFKELR